MMVDWKYKIFKMEYVQWICKMLKCRRNEKNIVHCNVCKLKCRKRQEMEKSDLTNYRII